MPGGQYGRSSGTSGIPSAHSSIGAGVAPSNSAGTSTSPSAHSSSGGGVVTMQVSSESSIGKPGGTTGAPTVGPIGRPGITGLGSGSATTCGFDKVNGDD